MLIFITKQFKIIFELRQRICNRIYFVFRFSKTLNIFWIFPRGGTNFSRGALPRLPQCWLRPWINCVIVCNSKFYPTCSFWRALMCTKWTTFLSMIQRSISKTQDLIYYFHWRIISKYCKHGQNKKFMVIANWGEYIIY